MSDEEGNDCRFSVPRSSFKVQLLTRCGLRLKRWLRCGVGGRLLEWQSDAGLFAREPGSRRLQSA